MDLKSYIRDVPDWPVKGIMFKDITPLLQNERAFSYMVNALSKEYNPTDIDVIAGIESRGFIIGGAMANELRKGFVPVRKKGKLPWKVVTETYAKEYGTDSLEMHKDAIHEGQKVLIVDDVLATGGTALAAAKLVEELGGTPEFCFAIELSFLNGRDKITNYPVFSLLRY